MSKRIAPRRGHRLHVRAFTLVELLAWLAEMVLYRLDEISPTSVIAFLQLLDQDAASWTAHDQDVLASNPAGLDQEIHRTILTLRERYRAVTPDDYEFLALDNTWQASFGAWGAQPPRIVRARCFPNRNLEQPGGAPDAPAHISLVVVSDEALEWPSATPEVCRAVWQFLDGRRLLATRHHVVGPAYVPVSVAATLVIREDARPDRALQSASDALAAFFHPLRGGSAGTGWPFGRAVYLSDVYAVLQQLPLVDHVIDVALSSNAGQERYLSEHDMPVGIGLAEHELPRIDASAVHAVDIRGITYQLTQGRAEKMQLKRANA